MQKHFLCHLKMSLRMKIKTGHSFEKCCKDEDYRKITSESGNQNIRFNNVELNNQSIDGPFGQDIEYNLNQKGDYSLVIGKV